MFRRPIFHQYGWKQPKGFTLIELLISIALVGIISAIGGMQLYGVYERNKVLDVTNEITTTLDRARTLALASSQPYMPKSTNPTCGGPSGTPVPQANPYVTDVGIFVHNDSSPPHDHIHLRYIFNCSPVNLGGSDQSPMTINQGGGWYYQDTAASNWWILDKTQDTFPDTIELSDTSFENRGVFFHILNGQVDYKPANADGSKSIEDPTTLPGSPASTRFVQVHSTKADTYYDICVYPDGHYVVNQSKLHQNTCT